MIFKLTNLKNHLFSQNPYFGHSTHPVFLDSFHKRFELTTCVFLAGGAVEEIVFKSKGGIKDFDIFVAHGPDEDIEEVQSSVIAELKTKFPHIVKDYINNKGYRIVTAKNKNGDEVVQLIFVCTEFSDRNRRIKHVLKTFDRYSSMFALYRDGLTSRYILYGTRLGMKSIRKKFAILNEGADLSPRSCVIRLARLYEMGWYINYAVDQLVKTIENYPRALVESNNVNGYLSTEFHVSEEGILKLPPEFTSDGSNDGS